MCIQTQFVVVSKNAELPFLNSKLIDMEVPVRRRIRCVGRRWRSQKLLNKVSSAWSNRICRRLTHACLWSCNQRYKTWQTRESIRLRRVRDQKLIQQALNRRGCWQLLLREMRGLLLLSNQILHLLLSGVGLRWNWSRPLLLRRTLQMLQQLRPLIDGVLFIKKRKQLKLVEGWDMTWLPQVAARAIADR